MQVVDTMREMSLQTDPQELVHAYVARMRKLVPTDNWLSISRRGMESPVFCVTRSSLWKEAIDPWNEPHRLPIFRGGLLSELIYGDQPRVINELEFDDGDPGKEFLSGHRSLLAIPHFDQGQALNMIIQLRYEPDGFNPDELPEQVWMSNLFGRATHNLVMSEKVRKAYEIVDQEMKLVADIQRSLLPRELPKIPGLRLAAHYQTSQRAGGDYYDFFPLPEGKWGIWIADVSGHGTAAAVFMAITHTIAHSYAGPPTPSGTMLSFVNRQLNGRYVSDLGTFVTAFYGVYDPQTRLLSYSSAGHNPPRLKHCGDSRVAALDGAQNLPLGVVADEEYPESFQLLEPGDQILFYTDGITEAHNVSGEQFGLDRLDEALSDCWETADATVQSVLDRVERFADGRPADDDRTLLVAHVM